MSLEAKQNLINSVMVQLSRSMSYDEIEKIAGVISKEMENYDVDPIVYKANDNEDMLDVFINALKIGGRSPKTLKRYRYIIRRLACKSNTPIKEMTVHDIRNYFASEKERGTSDRTLEGERQIFNRYFGWLQREGIIKINPVANICAIKYNKKVKDLFSDVDIELMKNSCKKPKNKAIITFLMSTGCRVCEMTGLNRDNVNLETLECKVLGKGSKERIVYLDNVAAMFMKQYLDGRKDDNNALFINLHKQRITTNGVRNILKRIESKSGVSNVHPHKFRRTLATNLIRRGMPIEEVAAILGHDKLDTTMEYVVLDKSEIKHAYNKFF